MLAVYELKWLRERFLRTIFALFPVLILYWVIPVEGYSDEALRTLNVVLPFYFIVVSGRLAWRVVGKLPSTIWTAIAWYPLNSAVFYGFGPMVNVLGNEVTRSRVSTGYLGLTQSEVFIANQLSLTGIFAVLLGFTAHLSYQRRSWVVFGPSKAIIQTFNPVSIGLAFVLLGSVLKYLLLKPAQWGIIHLTVPGILSGMGNLVDLGFGIVAFYAAKGNASMRSFLLLALPIHIFLSFLSFAKLEVILALLLPALGYFLGSGRRDKLIQHAILIALIFVVLQPWVHFGRSVILERTGTISRANYADRMEILSDYIFSDSRSDYLETRGDLQSWWTRLNFSGPQVRAMELYDAGFRNRTLNTAWMYFIPRVVWPDKPILYGPGLQFYRQLTGREDAVSFLGLSIYGDLYWQFGWLGVLVGGVLFGWVLGVTSALALRAIRSENFIMLPFVMMALDLAITAPNKYVINGVIGALPIMIAYYLLFSNFSKRRRLGKS
ncbi:MAG: hypothetical protein AAF498_01835 [Pseudomonadota bacterium]